LKETGRRRGRERGIENKRCRKKQEVEGRKRQVEVEDRKRGRKRDIEKETLKKRQKERG